ncbi:hypothetical protein FSHL1_010553 [Fusarium sambucinum]
MEWHLNSIDHEQSEYHRQCQDEDDDDCCQDEEDDLCLCQDEEGDPCYCEDEDNVSYYPYQGPAVPYYYNQGGPVSYRQGKGVVCPFCGANYRAASGIAHHLERGCCPCAPLDRDTMYQEVRRRDPDGIITNHFLEWQPTIHYQATELAYNPYLGEYECYLCHDSFRRLSSLNQHLESPRHQQNLYHCPNRSCFKEFTTLAGLVNHLESESCRFMRFQAIQNGMRGLVSSSRGIGFY